jgi:protein-disulfide isomerase
MELDGIPIKGKANAKVVMIEFADYECPYCAQHSNGVSKEIDKEFVETGKIRYAFANNPIPSHRNAIPLAQAAICGGQQDRYWQMHDRLYEAEPKTREELISIVDELGLDHLKFEQCLDQAPDAFKEIGRDTIAAKSLGFSATPAFAIGLADSQGRVQIQKLITGAQSFAVFKSAIGEIVQK